MDSLWDLMRKTLIKKTVGSLYEWILYALAVLVGWVVYYYRQEFLFECIVCALTVLVGLAGYFYYGQELYSEGRIKWTSLGIEFTWAELIIALVVVLLTVLITRRLWDRTVTRRRHADGGDFYDALIIYADYPDTKTKVEQYKTHLETDFIEENVRVELITNTGFGQTHFNMMENVFDKYRYILTFMTPRFKEDYLNHFKTQMSLMQSLEDPLKRDRIVPVWTVEGEDKTKIYPIELALIQGLHYWKFGDDNYRTMYLTSMQSFFRRGRESFLRN